MRSFKKSKLEYKELKSKVALEQDPEKGRLSKHEAIQGNRIPESKQQLQKPWDGRVTGIRSDIKSGLCGWNAGGKDGRVGKVTMII